MFSGSNRKNKLFSVPILYFLFGAYLLGSALGALITYGCNTSFSVSDAQLSGFSVFVRSVFYYGLIVLFARMPMGMLMIPLLVSMRGFALSITVLTLVLWNEVGLLHALIRCGIPAFIQLSALFYLSDLCFVMSLRRMRNHGIKGETIKEIRVGIFYAIAASILSATVSNLGSF